MPQGDKSSYSPKQRRKARHIEEGYEAKGVSRKKAERIGWATVNKTDGGAKGRKAGVTSRSASSRTRRRSTAR